ncbi:MAG TPA: hypothetical protein ENJ33_05750 [Thiothrix sp.]|nr:hypothetical protein [Thiothrix sp.]
MDLVNKPEKITQHEGTYFTRYVPEKKCSSQTVVPRKTFNVEIDKTVDLTAFTGLKFAISGVLIFLFIVGIAVSLYVYTTSSTRNMSSFDADGLVLVENNASSAKIVSNTLKQQSKQEWMAFADQHQLKTAICSWEQLAKCQQRYQDWMFVILAK